MKGARECFHFEGAKATKCREIRSPEHDALFAKRCELSNLVARYPGKVEAMSGKWDVWYKKCLSDTRKE